jgi:hypothetical protein
MTIARHAACGLATAGAALVLIVLLLCAPLARHAEAASKDAVDCDDISMSFDAKSGYELNCTKMTRDLAGMNGSYEEQRLQATAADGVTFVDAFHDTLMGQIILTGTDLRNNLKDFYGNLPISDWQTGRTMESLSTAEFRADMRGLPSHCVAFQRLGHHESGGYKKLMIGVSCSQGDIGQAYAALQYLHLPH